MRRHVAAPARVLALALFGQVRLALSKAPFGTAPEDEAKYSGATFRCFDGQGSDLPSKAVNDEFCDCADGSDEPGTGACAGQTATVFFCRNDGSTPRRLYASRVGDGICDCCDGSDEHFSDLRQKKTTCQNTCAEHGRLEREANQKRIAELTTALAEKERIKKEALSERFKLAEQIVQLEGELPALEESLKALTVEADKEREAEKQKREAEKAAQEANAKAFTNEACRWRQTGGCDPAGSRESDKDKICTATIDKGSSGFCDCDGNDQWDGPQVEPGFRCDGDGPGTCAAACGKVGSSKPADSAAAAATAAAAAAAGDEKPQVSEYAKWMEGAADKMSDDGAKPAEGEKPQVSEYTKWMDGAESKMKDEAGQAAPAQAAATTTTTTTEAPKSAIKEESEARRVVDRKKNDIQDAQSKVDAMDESHLGYASLLGKTLSKRVSEFNYQITFFSSAKQDSTNLGKWEKWTGPRSGTFEKGTRCWGGPDRMLNVNFQCGLEEAIVDAYEPSRCVYEAAVTHPGACEEEDLQVLVAGTRVIAAHEEL